DLGPVASLTAAVDALIAQAPEHGYVAVQAYLDRLVDESADDLRPIIAERSSLQTTFGWGPRFLHSTGQYHKGGHPNGVFLQIAGTPPTDIEVSGRPYTLAEFQRAQLLGNGQVLSSHGRPLRWLHLTDPAAGLSDLAKPV